MKRQDFADKMTFDLYVRTKSQCTANTIQIVEATKDNANDKFLWKSFYRPILEAALRPFKILSGQTLRPSWPAAAQCTAEKKLCLNWKPFYCSPAVNKLPRGSSALTSNPPKPDLVFSHPRVSLILLALILHEHELRTNPCGVVFTFSPNILLKHGIYGVRS